MGLVVLYGGEEDARHEQETRAEIARELAVLKQFDFDGRFDPRKHDGHPCYFVAAQTLDRETARGLGIRHEHDIFGGVVPHLFVATKVIAHPLVDDGAFAPDGWSAQLGASAGDTVLDGFSAFTRKDALRGGTQLLTDGPVRLKLPHGRAGRDQHVVKTPAELAERVDELDEKELATNGIVLEQNLDDVVTYSVGQVRVEDTLISYVGTQRLTRDNRGEEVYGGTTLIAVRGDYDALLKREIPDPAREAIAKTRVFDGFVVDAYKNMFASRRNYDVAQGRDAAGRERIGVLEQSWRIGGASGAELAVLTTLRRDSRVASVRASSYEIHGRDVAVPSHAKVYFDGEDDKMGRLVKYTVVDEYDGA